MSDVGERRSRSKGSPRAYSRSCSRDGGGQTDHKQRGSDDTENVTGNCLHVNGLPRDVDERELERIFADFGKVENVKIPRDPSTQEVRGFAFVTMSTGDQAQAAMKELSGATMSGRSLRVEISKRAAPHERTPGVYMGPQHSPPRRHKEGLERRAGPGGGGRYDDRRGRSPRYDDRPRYEDPPMRRGGGYDDRGGDRRRQEPPQRDNRRYDDRGAPPMYDERRNESRRAPPVYDDRRARDPRGGRNEPYDEPRNDRGYDRGRGDAHPGYDRPQRGDRPPRDGGYDDRRGGPPPRDRFGGPTPRESDAYEEQNRGGRGGDQRGAPRRSRSPRRGAY